MKAVVLKGPAGPEVLAVVERADVAPGPGEALVEVAAAGVNFMDMGVRHGRAGAGEPSEHFLGVEGARRVLAVGDGVAELKPGTRVAWVYAPGSYAKRALITTDALVPTPDGIDDLKLLLIP
ncbi:alcohol dehydrogenase catalytic domain-containing protein [Elioraea rosea]|uniref:alcohol dehydrogenase catalytic domain-containing protein n=1 Tax=Elioraea rosea TaxID=2492390 RepID=UPI001183988D|nr:alcohol dehydrogenase catalytic domain-containing protein [Elioraea rosea]